VAHLDIDFDLDEVGGKAVAGGILQGRFRGDRGGEERIAGGQALFSDLALQVPRGPG
jgi:hypothetical protein